MSPSPLALAREELAGQDAWLVGGAVRDDLIGRMPAESAPDIDVVLPGSPRRAAEAIRRAAGPGVAAFALSEQFGGWRVAGGGWQVDLVPVQGSGLEEDLRARDLTVNAIARPLAGGPEVDPTGGRADLEAGILRMASARSFIDDPLRVLRLARLSAQLGMDIDPATEAAAREAAPGLGQVAAERIFSELSLTLGAADPRSGMQRVAMLGAEAVVLPELDSLRGVEQTRYHHLDAHGHTLEVVERVSDLEADPAFAAGARSPEVSRVLDEPFADGLARSSALRWAALLHDIAKPQTRFVAEDGRVGFPGHDREGARVAREIMGRLRASDRLATYVAAITEAHLLLGFLVHRRPVGPAETFDYLAACDPLGVDVTLLSVADRLATRGRKSEEAIEAHMEVARPMMEAALDWHRDGPPRSPIAGDALAERLGMDPGPRLGELLAGIQRAVYTGEVVGEDEAVAWASRELAEG